MAHPTYLRAKAIELRLKRRMSIVEIAERLALPKTTIYYWVRDIPLGRRRRENPHAGSAAMQRRFRLLREKAYEEGRQSFELVAALDPSFRDFVCMYLGEGSKRNRNVVAIANSDPGVVVLATHWLRALSRRKLRFSVQYHADQDLAELKNFWGQTLGIHPDDVRTQRKSNSGQLNGRTWRSRWGVLTVATSDTLFRARLEGWMDCLREHWLHSAEDGA